MAGSPSNPDCDPGGSSGTITAGAPRESPAEGEDFDGDEP